VTVPEPRFVETSHEPSRILLMKRSFRRPAALLLAALASFAVAPVWGQEPPAPAPAPKGESHLTVERVQNGFVVAPDNRFTEVDGSYGNLLGVYGGWMMDRTLLIGAGGYWLTNGSHHEEMSYGGAVVEWLVHGDRRLGVSARALIGGGSATLTTTVPVLPAVPYPMPGYGPSHGHEGPPWPGWYWPPTSGTVPIHDGFFVFEPQVNVNCKVNGWLHISAGGGYRLVAGTHDMDSRLRGFSGSLSLQFGGGS
jgi:hypothetical protein